MTHCAMCRLIEGITRGANEASRELETPVSIAHMVRGGITMGMVYERHKRFTESEKSSFCYECKGTLAMAESAVKLLPERQRPS